jgi:hypothetical protein
VWVLFGNRGSLMSCLGFFFVLCDYWHCGSHVWFMMKGMEGREARRLPSSSS